MLPDLPITHLLYLASGLFMLGLVGVLLRRSPARVLLALVLLLSACALVFATFARAWGHTGGQVFAALLLTLTGVYAAVGAALLRGRD
jgi:NADH-quinone oxidoreductase subunit K